MKILILSLFSYSLLAADLNQLSNKWERYKSASSLKICIHVKDQSCMSDMMKSVDQEIIDQKERPKFINYVKINPGKNAVDFLFNQLKETKLIKKGV